MTGFIDGEGTFYVGISAKKDMALGYLLNLEFCITQNKRDLALMSLLPEFFGCGYIALMANTTTCQYRIRKTEDLEQHLFPVSDQYPLRTQKALDAAAFREVHALVKAKKHLTVEGLQQIRRLKATMNKGRSSIGHRDHVCLLDAFNIGASKLLVLLFAVARPY